jgi:hypothetical protein
MKRRRTVSKEELEAFVERVRDVMQQYPADRVINVNETNWRAMALGFLTWAKIGSESVTCQAGNDEKEGVTVIAAIDAAGNKLPLCIIGKRKTDNDRHYVRIFRTFKTEFVPRGSDSSPSRYLFGIPL